MRILDKHILRSITTIFVSSLLIFCFLYVLIDITSTLDEIIDRKIPMDILLRYYLAFLPIIVVQTSPVACLIATLFTFGNMNNNNEVIAMRSNGLSFWQITKPALCFGLIVSASIFWVNEKYVPQATAVTQQIREDNMILLVDRMKKQKSKIKNLTFYGLKNRLFYLDSFDPKTYDLEGISIIEYDTEQNIKQKITAYKGVWTGIAWKFYNCQVTTYAEDKINVPQKVKIYEEKLMDIKETPSDLLKQKLNVASMNIIQLKDYVRKFSSSGAIRAINSIKVDIQKKIADPFSNLVIIIVGLPFGLIIKSRKRTTFASLGIAVAIGFLYYVFNSVCIAFGKGGLFPPLIAAWLAPFIFVGIAITIVENNF